MLGRIVEVADNSRHLSLFRGFLIVHDKSDMKGELGRIPLDDILAVIAHAHGLSYTNNLLVGLAERGIPFVLCNDRHNAVGMLWPTTGHHQQAKRFDAQIAASVPKRKAIWAKVVRAKIHQQALVLVHYGLNAAPLVRLESLVRSGDPENKEAQAARIYWSSLFGADFIRDRNALGINALLNYGYTILRSAMARAIIAAGLHPSIGIHHCNEANPMRLVDDLMEPYRPVIDSIVANLQKNSSAESPIELTADVKGALVGGLFISAIQSDGGCCPIMVSMQELATSLAQVYLGEKQHLLLPECFDVTEEQIIDP